MSGFGSNEPANTASHRAAVPLEDIKKDIERSKNRSFYGMLVAICIAIAGILGFAYMSIATVNDAENSVRTANEVSARLGEVTARLEDTNQQVEDYKAQLSQLVSNGASSAEMDRLKQKLTSLSREFTQLEETEAALRREKTRLETQVEVAQSDVLAALDKNEDLKTVIKQSSSSLAQARRAQNDAEEKLTSARSAQQMSRIALRRANSSKRSVQNELIAVRHLQQQTQATLNTVRRSLPVRPPSYPDLRSKLARATQLQRRTQSALDRARKQLANSGASNLRQALNRARADLVRRNQTITQRNQTIRSLRNRLSQCAGGGNAQQISRRLRNCLRKLKVIQ